MSYVYSIPYYEKVVASKYHYPYNKEKNDVIDSFYRVCSELKGKKFTAVRSRSGSNGYSYRMYKDRYDAAVTGLPFYNACVCEDLRLILENFHSKNENQFGFSILDLDKYDGYLTAIRLRDQELKISQAEYEKAQREERRKSEIENRAKAREKEKQDYALRVKMAPEFRKNLSIGDITTFGMVIEIKKPIAKIQVNNGGEKWYKIDQLLPKFVQD